jgi:hypothetical protein
LRETHDYVQVLNGFMIPVVVVVNHSRGSVDGIDIQL